MKRLLVLLVLSVAFWGYSAEKPNIVLINVDDLGATDLASFGSSYYETPNLDKMVADGMKFTNAYAACAVCSPTRAAIMTGSYPSRIGITDWIRARFQGGKVPADGKNPSGWSKGGKGRVSCPQNPLWMEHEEVTIAEHLKAQGYVSCHIGKWHLGPDNWYPEKQGFDFNYGGCDYGQPPSFYDPYTNKRLKQGIPNLPPRKTGEYLGDREGDEAVKFIRDHKDKPFFLYLAFYEVHTPIQGRKDLVEKYKAKQPKGKQKSASYAAMVENVDINVGKVIKVLDELKLSDKTMVIFTSDNGGLMGPTNNAPFRSGKGNPYEGGIRIPQIIKWPGKIKAGSVSDEPVISVDFMPTICDALAIDLPKGRQIDGVSLVPLFTKKALKRDALLWHFPHYRGRIVPYSIIRAGDWKLLKRYSGPTEFELFNLKDDIGETKDLAKTNPEKVKELNKQLEQLLKDTNSKIPKQVQ